MLQDVHLVDVARKIIRDEQTGAEWAVRKALDQIQAVFDRIEDPYFRDRSSDIAVVGERLLRNLMGMVETNAEEAAQGSIVIAHDLSPADTAQLGRAEAAGFCTEAGGRTSHTAIVARALGMPLCRRRGGAGPQGLVGHAAGRRRHPRRGDPRSRTPRRCGAIRRAPTTSGPAPSC